MLLGFRLRADEVVKGCQDGESRTEVAKGQVEEIRSRGRPLLACISACTVNVRFPKNAGVKEPQWLSMRFVRGQQVYKMSYHIASLVSEDDLLKFDASWLPKRCCGCLPPPPTAGCMKTLRECLNVDGLQTKKSAAVTPDTFERTNAPTLYCYRLVVSSTPG